MAGAPAILRGGIVDIEEARMLIQMCVQDFRTLRGLMTSQCLRYFDYMNASTGLLDPAVYTPESVLSQTPFLCAVGELRKYFSLCASRSFEQSAALLRDPTPQSPASIAERWSTQR